MCAELVIRNWAGCYWLPQRKIGWGINLGFEFFIEFRIKLNRNTPEFGGIGFGIELAIDLL